MRTSASSTVDLLGAVLEYLHDSSEVNQGERDVWGPEAGLREHHRQGVAYRAGAEGFAPSASMISMLAIFLMKSSKEAGTVISFCLEAS